MTRLFAIARNAFVETIRQPIYGVLILVTIAVLVLDTFMSSGYTMGRGSGEYAATDQQMMINLGLSTLLVSGALIVLLAVRGGLAGVALGVTLGNVVMGVVWFGIHSLKTGSPGTRAKST